MTFLYSLLLGLVQGLTEFLPVSSSGHLAILQNLLGLDTDLGVFFEVLLHLGTTVALVMAFYKDIRLLALEGLGMLLDLWRNIKIFIVNKKNHEDKAYRRIIHNNNRKFLALILVSTIPTAILGFYSRNLVKLASQNLLCPGIGLLLTGILLLVVDQVSKGQKIPREITWANAMWVGICQGMAVFPGISRAGVTLCACLLCGMSKKTAVKYSFLMSIPSILGALVLEISMLPGSGITAGEFFTYLSGAIVAAAVGYFCIRMMIRMVRNNKLRVFSYYCFAVGILAAAANYVIL